MLKLIVFLALFLPTVTNAEPLDSVIAIVNDGVITTNELNKETQTLTQQLIAAKSPMPTEQELRKKALQRLINVDLELQLAKQHNLSIDDNELNQSIMQIATSNHLSLNELRQEIERQNITWSYYRDTIRKEILIMRLQQKALSKDVIVSNQQVDDYLKASSAQDNRHWFYHIEHLIIPLPDHPDSATIRQAQQKASQLLQRIKKTPALDFNHLAIEESTQQFSLEGTDLGTRRLEEMPEIFAQALVTMSIGQTVGPLKTNNGLQLLRLIAIDGKNKNHQIIKTHVRHILLKPEATMTETEARRQINNLYQQLNAGKDFALMAKQYSTDTATGHKGGDLGWVTPGELTPEFEKQMNKLAINDISKPTKSTFGWHLIQVLARKKVDDSNEFKRQQARQLLQQKKFQEAVLNWQQQLQAEAYIKILDKTLL